MASAYKCAGRNTYYMEFIDQHGRKRTNINSKIADRKTAENLVHQIETDAQRIKAGMPALLPEVTGPFLGTVNRTQTNWQQASEAYLAELLRLGTPANSTHYRDCRTMLARIGKECSWPTVRAVNAPDFTRFLGSLAKAGRAPRTQHHYFAKLRAACNFWKRQGWIPASPLEDVQDVPVGQRGRRRFRRPFTLDELHRLCSVVCSSVPGRAAAIRATYTVAAFSGFRYAELRRLTREDCTPTGPQPRWHVPASRTKNGMPVDLPMTPEAAEALAPLWMKLLPGQPLLYVPGRKRFLRHRTKAQIPAQDERGRWADFHSLRYSFATFMSRLYPLEVVSRLMRHSTVTLTAQIYMDLGLDRKGQDAWVLQRSSPLPNTSPNTFRITA
jgi:integrase